MKTRFTLLFQLALRTGLALTLAVISILSQAQEKSNKGTEFWIGFMQHVEGTDAGMSLYITSDSSTSGTVSIPGQSWSANYTVTANSMTVVNIPVSSAYINCSDCIQSKGVRVTSLKDVIVYAHHYEGNKSDATLVLPTPTQGKEYYLMGHTQNSFDNSGRNVFTIVATKDSTVVNITPSVDLLGVGNSTLTAGTTYQRTLDAGEVYQAIGRYGSSSYDITGTYIEVIDTGVTANCRTIAVFSGSTYTTIGGCSGPGINSGDNIMEQMFPINSWGKQFVLVPALGRKNDNFRFVASRDNTQVVVYNSVGAPDVFYLDEGEYAEITNETNVRAVNANGPIMVAQFQQTSRCDGGGNRVGDPSMTILNPLEQTLEDITLYSSRYFDIDNHYINIVIPTHKANTFRLDGNTVSFTAVPRLPSYSYTRQSVSVGNHRLTADIGFIAIAYGEGDYESYGYAAGANVKDLAATITVPNSPLNTETANCLGSPTQFRGNADYQVIKWEWDFGDGSGDTVQNPNHYYADTGTYHVKLYTYKQQLDGCSVYDSVLIDVHVYASPVARMITDNLCDSVTARFVDSSTVAAPESYLTTRWNINNGADIYRRNKSKIFDSVGKYPIRMITITSHQCKDTIQDSIVISPNPELFFGVQNSCYFDSSYFTNTSAILSGTIDNYLWDFHDGDSSNSAQPTHFYPDSGMHYITLEAWSDSGCYSIYEDSLYKHPRMVADFSMNDTCVGIQNTFLNSSELDGGSYTDTLWYTSEMDTFYSYDLQKTFANTGSFTVTLVMEQDSFCRDTITKTIDVHAYASVDFQQLDPCFGDSTTFTSLINYSGNYTLSWDFDDNLTGTDSIERIVYSSIGNKTVVLSANTEEGCTSSNSKVVRITDPRIIDLDLDDQCLNEVQDIAAVLSAGNDTFTNYDWQVNGANASTDSLFTHTAAIVGVNYVDLLVNTANGCMRTFTDSFSVYALPEAVFTVNSACSADELIPVNNSSVAAPSTLSSYKWFVNGVQSSTQADPVFTAGNSGQTTIKLLITSSHGCLDSTEVVTNVHPLPSASFTENYLCLGQQTNFVNTSTIPSGTIAGIYWDIDGNFYNISSPVHQFASTGTYNVKLLVRTDSNCLDSVSKNITIYPIPQLDVKLSDFEGCEPFVPTITNNSTIESGVISTYNWDWGDGNSTEGDPPYYQYPTAGTYTVKVVATSDQGCISSFTLTDDVIVQPNPFADFIYSPTDIHVIVTPVDFMDMSSSDVTSWIWNIASSTYTTPNANHTFLTAGYIPVELIVINDNGCRDSITKDIFVNDSLFIYIPNAFFINGNGVNETFGLGGITTAVTDMTMQIYNRWGELIYETHDVNDKWDGTYKGVDVPQGVYLYKFKYTNPQRNRWYYKNGTVRLLR